MLSKTIAEILNGDDPWHYATFEGAVQLQLKIDARTSLAEKLEWLEQAGRLARQLEGQTHGQPILEGNHGASKEPNQAAFVGRLAETEARFKGA
jgi:hypothetical protein